MEHSPSSEANFFSASQEVPPILWNPKFHNRIYNVIDIHDVNTKDIIRGHVVIEICMYIQQLREI
jgi:hypothetical protein